MIREEYLRRLVDACHVDLYLSATDGARTYWPWRMMPVHEADKRHRNACEHFVLDSSFQHEYITNEDVLDKAAALDVEMTVLADVWHDKDATVDAILDGLELYDDHEFDGDILVPLQPPHDECYADLAGQADAYAIGGVKDASDATKIDATRAVREVAGDDAHLHGLGFGVTDTLVEAVQDDPALLDSVDYSTPIQNAMNDPALPGKERMSVVASRAATQLVEDARKLSPFVDVSPDDLREKDQAGLEGFA